MSPENAAVYSLAPIDSVVAVHTGSVTIPVRTDPENTVTLSTGLSGSCFWQGVFTIDGKTWHNDIGGREFLDDGAGAYTEYGLEASSSSGSITLTTKTNDTSTHTCSYLIATIAKPNQGLVSLDGSNKPVINENLFSLRNYQKIYKPTEDPITYTVSSAATSSRAIAHNLGYRPSARAFIEISGQLYDTFARPTLVTVGFTTATVEVQVDASNITYFFTNGTGVGFDVVLYPRIYYDAS